jgi:predicted nucleic acid-binding protein
VPPAETADTSILIPFFRSGVYQSEIRSASRAKYLYLSSLVALELYAGARDQAEKRALDRFVASFVQRGRILVPAHEDCALAGILLARQRRLAGDLAVRNHLVDVLIVLSASQVGGTVITANLRHLELWASLARRAGRSVRVRAPAE